MAEDPFIARYMRGKLALMILACLAGLAIFALLAIDPASFGTGTSEGRLFGAIGILLFGLLLLVNVSEFFRKGSVLIVGSDGLLWSRWSNERLPWEAFKAARIGRIEAEQVISLWLSDPDRYRSRSALGRVARLNRLSG